MTVQTKEWDVAEHLKSVADIAAYLAAVLEDGDPDLFAAAMADIQRAGWLTDSNS